MGYIQGLERKQIIFLPDTLNDYVGEENEVRAIDTSIDIIDIAGMGFKAEPAREGRPSYDLRDMLKLYMYGYLNYICSSRRLQKETSRNVDLMWLIKKAVPNFRCIADIRKGNTKAIREVFKAFVRLCNKAGLLSHQSVVIDGTKFRADCPKTKFWAETTTIYRCENDRNMQDNEVRKPQKGVFGQSEFRAANADKKSYVVGSAKKVLLDAEGKISQYMKELDEAEAEEARPGALGKEDITKVLDYLERRKKQLTEALAQMEHNKENQVCTTDPECRLMKTRNGIRPSFNVQTAAEPDNPLIVHYDVTNK